MNENRISIKLLPEDIADINAAIQTLQTKLSPYLIALDGEDKRALAKMKDKSVPFVEKVLQYMETNPEFTPAYVDKGEIKKDYDAFGGLNNVLRPLLQIVSNLEDTAFLCGSETYTSTLAYYGNVKQASKMNVPNARAIYDDLKVRFEAQAAKPVEPKPTP
jgi:hypothetical protein